MPGHGPPPKQNPETDVELERDTRGIPVLPRTYDLAGQQVRYMVRTRDWWDSWTGSPQAERITRTGWQRLLMLSLLVDRYHRTLDKNILGEIRLNESKFGATPEDMQRLHWNLREKNPDAVGAPAAATGTEGSPIGPKRFTVVPKLGSS